MQEIQSPKIQSVSLKKSKEGQYVILWGASDKAIPPSPENNEKLSESNTGYWHDREYAGWTVRKENIPESPRNGACGKSLIYLQPDNAHPYMQLYAKTIKEKCEAAGIHLSILNSDWDEDLFDKNVKQAIQSRPDMILLNPEHQQRSNEWYRMINEAGIPVIGGNFLADNEGHRYLLAWTGPDDWGQSRLLARTLADAMEHKGGYCILQHYEGNSSYYARTWGVTTELNTYAPTMECLDSRPGMDAEAAEAAVEEWIKEFGPQLKGIFSADDGLTMERVSKVLEKHERRDICCVAAGSSSTGLRLIQEGKLLATSYQSPVIDGETAIRTIVDWFEGLPVEAIRYLPKHIVTQKDAADFLTIKPQVNTLNLEHLYSSIRNLNWIGTYNFFGDLYEKILTSRVIPQEMFQGICLEILCGLIVILKEEGVSVEDVLGSYDSLMKHLLRDKEAASVLEWMNTMSQQVITAKLEKINRKTPIQEVIEYIDHHLNEPMSLKSLSYQFSISQAYLGQVFRRETGSKFSDYLNAKRVERAKVLLKGSNTAINAVAHELGYTDPAYFYKIFKKVAGVSASEYISRNRKS